MTEAQRFGTKLRALRIALGLTQAEFGERIGLSGANINHFESGRRAPSLVNIVRILKATGAKPERLLP